MQLYMLLREKMMIDKQFTKDGANSSHSSSHNYEDPSQDDNEEDESSYTSSSQCNSNSYENLSHMHRKAYGLMHPSDMILEQSNDDDESYLD